MNNIIFVVFLLLFAQSVAADNNSMQNRVLEIEESWVDTADIAPVPRRTNLFLQLTEQISDVVIAFPRKAEPLILKSAILLTMAEDASSFVALGLVNQAKKLLSKAIDINPKASDGSALVTMGVLYYKVPPWPIAFGDDVAAEMYLLKALEVSPNGVSSNYFYADFLLNQGKEQQATAYLNRAIEAKIDPKQASFKIKQKQKQKAKVALAELSS